MALERNRIHFERSEYDRRLRKTKERMDHAGIEVLLVVDPANMNYLTGYDGWSFYVHQGVIVVLDREEPIWFGRRQDSNGARITTWLTEDSILGYPDEYVQSRYTHTMVYVANLLRGEGWDRRVLGLELDNYWFSARMLLTLQEEIPDLRTRDATNLVNWVRTVKSDPEIRYMREAAEICTRVMNLAIENIAVGTMEKDVAAIVAGAQIAGTDRFGGDSPAIFPIMPSGQNTSTAHLTFDPDRAYRSGDVVLLELAGARRRYHAPLSRTVYLGDPPADLRNVADTVVRGLNETLDHIRPGITAEEVEARWRESIRGSGVEKPSRVGYAYGLNYVPDWGEHTVSLRPGDKTVLERGMTIHFMPGIWLDTYGFECSEPFLVTEDGCEKFIDFPQKLFVR
ncbi:MAG: M24 family metallopeptidase [Spirochaetaceae bacterium]|nr:MAG: M24 family metallopeptidase [Spirochaetaceae bacterium]